MMWNLKLVGVLVIAGATLLAGTAWKAYSAGSQAGANRIQAQWDAEVSAMAKAQAEELQKAWTKTADLQAEINQLQRTHRNEISRINTRHATLVDSLRDRPETRADPASVSGSTGTGTEPAAGCTGAQLSGPDSRFLAGESALAAELQSALRTCMASYNRVRALINGGTHGLD